MSEELRQIIVGYGGDPTEWKVNHELAIYEGESADGIPNWNVWKSAYGGFVIRREIGWYEQQGDADSVDEAVRLMNALDAADKAMQKVMCP